MLCRHLNLILDALTDIRVLQEFEQLQSARHTSASAADARTTRKLPSTEATASDPMPDSEPESSIPSEEEDGGESSSGEEEQDEQQAGQEDSRHQAMLAEVTGAVSYRKRKRVAVANEAYPDSEYNLPPTSGAAGRVCGLSFSYVLHVGYLYYP